MFCEKLCCCQLAEFKGDNAAPSRLRPGEADVSASVEVRCLVAAGGLDHTVLVWPATSVTFLQMRPFCLGSIPRRWAPRTLHER